MTLWLLVVVVVAIVGATWAPAHPGPTLAPVGNNVSPPPPRPRSRGPPGLEVVPSLDGEALVRSGTVPSAHDPVPSAHDQPKSLYHQEPRRPSPPDHHPPTGAGVVDTPLTTE